MALGAMVDGVNGDSNMMTASATGQAHISCVCILGTNGCPLKAFDAMAGQQRHTWTQDASVQEGHE